MNKQGSLHINTKGKDAKLGDLFGIFFEDLNHAADGGLYAELVQNRSFEFDPIDNPAYHHLAAWEKIDRGSGKLEVSVGDIDPLNEKKPHYLLMEVKEAGDGVGVMNSGYNTGIPVKRDEKYNFSFYAKVEAGSKFKVTIALESIEGKIYDQDEIKINSSQWEKYELELQANDTDYSSRLLITTKNRGKLYLDMVSLFPQKTFKNRPNGMHDNIAQLLADMKPRFMRFPGGCLVHDGSLDPDDRDLYLGRRIRKTDYSGILGAGRIRILLYVVM